jgi:hypothetical protein
MEYLFFLGRRGWEYDGLVFVVIIEQLRITASVSSFLLEMPSC